VRAAMFTRIEEELFAAVIASLTSALRC